MDGSIGAHSVCNKLFLDKILQELDLFLPAQLYGQCRHKFTGEATVLCGFGFLHSVPQGFPILPLCGSGGWQKNLPPPKSLFACVVKQNSLRLEQSGAAEIQASLDSPAANKKITWSSTPDGVVQITQDPVDGTKAIVKPLKEGSTTVTVAAEGGQEIALCSITIKSVKKETENTAAISHESGVSGAGICAFFRCRKRNKK